MKAEIRRLNEPLYVGTIYEQHGRQYLVMEHLDDCLMPAVHLRRLKDGWELDAVGAALYETPRGVEIMWAYSKNGRFVERRKD